MMAYLKGNREDLVVIVERDGVEQEFFTDREKAHMSDVRGLFVGALAIRNGALVLCALIILILVIIGKSESSKAAEAALVTGRHDAGTGWREDSGTAKHGSDKPALKRVPIRVTAARTYIVTSIVTLAVAVGIGYLFSQDFTKYFTIFHKIFFDNDLWLLDPAKDDLINLLPEGFFSDTAAAILITFLACLIISFIIAIVVAVKGKKKMRTA